MMEESFVPGEGSSPLSVSGSIQLSALPASPELSSRLFGLAPVRCRRFTKSPRTSPSNGSSYWSGLCRFCALAQALARPLMQSTFLLEWGTSSAGPKSYRQPPSLSWQPFLSKASINNSPSRTFPWPDIGSICEQDGPDSILDCKQIRPCDNTLSTGCRLEIGDAFGE